jgi:nucleotide-binding universal stress UspA family protein
LFLAKAREGSEVFDHILCPVAIDAPSQRALLYAVRVSESTRLPLTVMTVVDNASDRSGAVRLLDGLIADASAVGSVRTAVQVGAPAQRICAQAEALGAPLLVMSTRRSSRPLSELVFGSVSADVLRHGGYPMLLVGPACKPEPDRPFRLERLAVCLDGSEVSKAILPLVRFLAASLGVFVMLCHVIYPPVDPVTGDAILSRENEEMYRVLGQQARNWQAEGLHVDWRVDSGTWPAETIVAQAERRAMDIIAMATHGRSALTQMPAGSTTSEVLRLARVPVLMVRPSARLH